MLVRHKILSQKKIKTRFSLILQNFMRLFKAIYKLIQIQITKQLNVKKILQCFGARLQKYLFYEYLCANPNTGGYGTA